MGRLVNARLLHRFYNGELLAQFLSSGFEAVEAAIKLARQVRIERGQPARHLIISR